MTQSWDLYLQVGQMGWERGGVNSMSDIIYIRYGCQKLGSDWSGYQLVSTAWEKLSKGK